MRLEAQLAFQYHWNLGDMGANWHLRAAVMLQAALSMDDY